MEEQDTIAYDGWASFAALGTHIPPDDIGSVLKTLTSALQPGAIGVMSAKPDRVTQYSRGGGRWYAYWNPGDLMRVLADHDLHTVSSWHRHGPYDGERGWDVFVTRLGRA